MNSVKEFELIINDLIEAARNYEKAINNEEYSEGSAYMILESYKKEIIELFNKNVGRG